MVLSPQEIKLLRIARTNVDIAISTKNKIDIGLTVEKITDLGLHVLLLFVSDEVFEQRIKE